MIVIKFLRFTFVSIFLSTVISSSSFGQEVEVSELIEKKNNKTWRLAQEAKRTNNLYLAQNYLEQLYVKDTTDHGVILELAEIYRLTHNYPKTEKFYTKIVNGQRGKNHPEALFYLGQVQKNLEKYPEAKTNFEKFKKKVNSIGKLSLAKLYKTELEGCTLALQYKDSMAKSITKNLGNKVNKSHIDFSPIPISENKIVYGSYSETKERVYELSDTVPLEIGKRRFFVAEKKNNEWATIETLPGPFNDANFDVANGCFSLDGKRFYFTKCLENWQYKMICSIFESKLSNNGKWSEPKKLEMLNDANFTSTHPTIGRESKRNLEVIYFVSDREGTKGGMDIWYSPYDPNKKEFKKARNCGSRLNTIGDEMTPFYDLPAKTLYFSTDGRPNLGGLDVYSMTGEGSKWENPKHVGMQINSAADDLDFILKTSNQGGFFVSNRSGGLSLYHSNCCDDLYEFEYTEFINIDLDIALINKSKLNLCEKGPGIVDIYVIDEDGKMLIEENRNICLNSKFNLRPNQTYLIIGKQDGYFPFEKMVSTKFITESLSLKETLVLDTQPIEPMLLSDIRYEFDSPNLTKESKNILDTTLLLILNKYENTKIEIMAHTDSKGSDAYNLNLSQKRAESVTKYLVSKGVLKVRLEAKGYGETQPIAPNENPDGSDNPVGRQKNRRTEFKIIGEIQQEIINIDEEDY